MIGCLQARERLLSWQCGSFQVQQPLNKGSNEVILNLRNCGATDSKDQRTWNSDVQGQEVRVSQLQKRKTERKSFVLLYSLDLQLNGWCHPI